MPPFTSRARRRTRRCASTARTTGRTPLDTWLSPGPHALSLRHPDTLDDDQALPVGETGAHVAVALYWLLGAYGQQLGSLDDAIALIGPGTSISTRLGLLDARGPALARALA